MKKTTKKKDAKNSFRFSSVYHFIARAFLIGFLGVLFCTLTLLVLYVGDLFINVMSGNSKKPLFGAYVIMSGSMVPTIQVKDGIVVRRVANDSYQVGST